MKTPIRPIIITLPVSGLLFVLLLSMLTKIARAQCYRVIKSFGVLTNVCGWEPFGSLTQGPDGTLYGTAYDGEGPVVGGECRDKRCGGRDFQRKATA